MTLSLSCIRIRKWETTAMETDKTLHSGGKIINCRAINSWRWFQCLEFFHKQTVETPSAVDLSLTNQNRQTNLYLGTLRFHQYEYTFWLPQRTPSKSSPSCLLSAVWNSFRSGAVQVMNHCLFKYMCENFSMFTFML